MNGNYAELFSLLCRMTDNSIADIRESCIILHRNRNHLDLTYRPRMTKKIRINKIKGSCTLFLEYIPEKDILNDKIFIAVVSSDIENGNLILSENLLYSTLVELLTIRSSDLVDLSNDKRFSAIFTFYKLVKNYISQDNVDYKKQISLMKNIKQMDTMPDKKVLHLDPIILRMKYDDCLDRYDTNIFLSGNMDYLPITHFLISLDEIKYVFEKLISL